VDAEAVYLDLHRLFPNDPLPLIWLAEQKLYYEDQPEAAISIPAAAIPME
jgi:hypothetical protein